MGRHRDCQSLGSACTHRLALNRRDTSTGGSRCAARVHLFGTLAHPVQGAGGPSAFRAPRGRVCDMGCPQESFRFTIEFSTPRAPYAAHVIRRFRFDPVPAEVSGDRPRRPGLVCLRIRYCRNRAVIVNPVGEIRLFRLLEPHVTMSAAQTVPAGLKGAPAPVEPRTARKGLTHDPRDGGGVQACLCTPTPPRCRNPPAWTVHRRLWGDRRAEPARTLWSCRAPTPCPLRGRSAPDRDGDPCAGCAPRLPGLCAPLGDDPTFATRRQNCQPSQVRRGFSNSRTLLTAWSEIGLKADDLHRQAPRTGLERRSVRRTRFTAY